MCTSPIPASFDNAGNISFSKRKFSRELTPFQIPCGQCIECKLEYAREWAIRAVHEAKLHEENCFITLTYAPEHLPSHGKLQHKDFQDFMKRLRFHFPNREIGFLMCGEYGEKTKRPHYHACLFGLDFKDKEFIRQNDRGDQIYNSETLTKIWQLGHTELGSVTMQSAGYVARYVIKKQKEETEFKPYLKSSRKYAIGARWLSKFWRDIFTTGQLILDGGVRSKIPRYYEKWLLKNHPEQWLIYKTEVKPEQTKRLQQKGEQEHAIYLKERDQRGFRGYNYKSPLARKREILKIKAQLLKRRYDERSE